jgi:predicted transcriptional regulator
MKNGENLTSKRKPPQRKLSFAADDDLIARIDACARATRVTKSWLIRQVCSGWLDTHKGEV